MALPTSGAPPALAQGFASLLLELVGPSGILPSSVLSHMGLLVYTVFLFHAFSFGLHALRASWPLGPRFFANDQINGLSQYH